MLRKYDPEHNQYTHYVPLEDMEEMKKQLAILNERLKNTPVFKPDTKEMHEDTVDFDINDIDTIKQYISHTKTFHIDAPINNRHASLLLVACYFANNMDVIKYLLSQGASSNKTDVFGYNPLMSVIMNEYMSQDTKLGCIDLLLEYGCDINWLNILAETALTIAIARCEFAIAHRLLDAGAILYTIQKA